MYTPVDYAIICALDVEKNILCEVFDLDCKELKKQGSLNYWSKNLSGKHVRIVCLGDENQGVLNASIVATEVIISWKPRCIISYGLAGRALIDDEDISLKDVVCGSDIIYYEPGKETDCEMDTNRIGFMSYAKRTFKADNQSFDKAFTDLQNMELHYRIKAGEIFSGEKKIASKNGPIRQLLATTNRKTLAIEMEAAGVGGANERHRVANSLLFLSVKGLSDDAGRAEAGQSRPAERLKTRSEAARNAAFVMKYLIENANHPYVFNNDSQRKIAGHWEKSSNLSQLICKFADAESTVELYGEKHKDHYGSTELCLEYLLLSLSCRSDTLPPVYMHWKVSNQCNHINWVDFYHLLLLEKIATVGHPVHVLLTDENLDLTQRTEIEKIIKSVIRKNLLISWYSDELLKKNMYEVYADSQLESLGYNFFKERNSSLLEGSPFYQNVEIFQKSLNKPEVFWAKFIIWSTQRVKNFLVFALKDNLPIWSSIIGLYSRDTILVVRKYLRLNEYQGKSEMPGAVLCINPPHHAQFMIQLREENDKNVLQDFLNYFSEITDDFKLSKDHPRDSALNIHYEYFKSCSTPEEIIDLKFQILNLLSFWNIKYFKEKK